MNNATEKVLKKLNDKFKERLSLIEELGKDESDSKYYIWLKDEWMFDDGSHMQPASTIKEIVHIIQHGTYPIDEMISFNEV